MRCVRSLVSFVVGMSIAFASFVSGACATSETPRPVIVLNKWQEAPYQGMLMSEERFLEFLDKEIERDKLWVQLKRCERYNDLMQRTWREHLDAVAYRPWYRKPEALAVFSAVGAVIVTSLAWWSANDLAGR